MVTLKEVAQAAGVSISTASNALNNKGFPALKTREKVLKAASDLGYRPNPLAKGLRTTRVGIIALTMGPLQSLDSFQPEGVDYFLRFAGAASLVAMQNGYTLMLVSDPMSDSAPAASRMADGYVVADPFLNDPTVAYLQERAFPTVMIGVEAETVNEDPEQLSSNGLVVSNTDEDTVMLLEHLSEAGAARPVLVVGTDQNQWNLFARRSYEKWCLGRSIPPRVYEVDETLGVEGGKQVWGEIRDVPDVDAVYCLTGRHAAGLAEAAKHDGRRIPDDLLIASGSDSEQTRSSEPSITSFDLQPEKNAELAVDLLVSMLENDGSEVRRVVAGAEPKLLIRGSTQRSKKP